jgi:hypothetical protein
MSNEGIRGHLMEIYERRGVLTPEIVVEEARSKQHPLHGYVFDRPPKEAAEAWYRERAHRLIQIAQIAYQETPESNPSWVRAFHHVRDERGHVYEPVEKVASDPFLRDLVLRDMEREWQQLYKRYSEFEEFIKLVLNDIGVSAAA